MEPKVETVCTAPLVKVTQLLIYTNIFYSFKCFQ